MNPVIDYTIITNNSMYFLLSQVRTLIQTGWEPLGGIGIDTDDRLYQAMVKRAEVQISINGTEIGTKLDNTLT